MTVLKKVWMAISLVFTNAALGKNISSDGVLRVKDLHILGLSSDEVSNAFSDEIQLSREEYVQFKSHHESKKIDIATLDGRFRSFNDKEHDQPRNLIGHFFTPRVSESEVLYPSKKHP